MLKESNEVFMLEGIIIVSSAITVNLVMTLDPEGISKISALSFIGVEYLPTSENITLVLGSSYLISDVREARGCTSVGNVCVRVATRGTFPVILY